MSARRSPSVLIIVSMLFAATLILFAQRSLAATAPCPAGNQPATATDLAAMQAAGYPNPQVGDCWNPSSPYVGQDSGQAKQDLQGMVCNTGVDIQHLDSNFAVCADKFMKALRQVSPSACIRSGYRSVQAQLAACMSICGASSCPGKCAAPGQSFHQRGLAIDVDVHTSNATAWQIAAQSTNGGVANPSGLHSSDPNHFQATGSACSGAPVPASDNTDVYTGTQTGPMSAAPQQPLQPTSVAQPASSAAQPAQTTATTPTATTPTATTPVVTTTAPLTTTATSSAASTLLASLAQPLPSSLFQTSASATQALNILTNLGSVASSGPIGLNGGVWNVINTIIAGTTTTSPPDTQAAQTIPYPQDTFSPQSTQYVPTYPSAVTQILDSIKAVLQQILSIL